MYLHASRIPDYMDWNSRYAYSEVVGDISSMQATGGPLETSHVKELDDMGAHLNSHAYGYTGRSGQSATQRMYEGAGGGDLDNQELLGQQRSAYTPGDNTAAGRAAKQIALFTGKQSYGSDVRTNKGKYPELHHLIENADSSQTPALHRGIILGDKTHGTTDVAKYFRPGSVISSGVTSTSSDPQLAKDWVLDDKSRIDKAKSTGDTSLLDSKYQGNREFSYVNMHYPPKTQGLQVASLSAVPEHNEYATAAGQFRVSRVEGPDQEGVHHVYLEHHNPNQVTATNWNTRYSSEIPDITPEQRTTALINTHQGHIDSNVGLVNGLHPDHPLRSHVTAVNDLHRQAIDAHQTAAQDNTASAPTQHAFAHGLSSAAHTMQDSLRPGTPFMQGMLPDRPIS